MEVTALCDLDGDLLRKMAEEYSIPKQYRIFDDMLESDIDAVLVSTPMQFHVMQSIAALEAGKHVMSEVTAGVTFDELWWLIETVEKSGKVYMMAENSCYIPQLQIVKNMADAGLFGELYFAEGEYLHNIVSRAVYPNGKTSWRTYWQLGKRGGFYPTHSIGPVIKCFNNKRIKSVSSFGTGSFTRPEFRQDDTSITVCTLEDGQIIKIRVDCLSNRPHKMDYYSLQGTKGVYEAPRGLGDDHKVYIEGYEGMEKQGDNPIWKPLSIFEDKFLPERYKTASEEAKNAGHQGGDYFIVYDFINSIKKGVRPYVDVYDACEWTAVALLSELSVTKQWQSKLICPISEKPFQRRSKK